MYVGHSEKIHINPNYAVITVQNEVSLDHNTHNRRKNLLNTTQSSHKKLSPNAERKLSKGINYLTYLAYPKKVFNPKFNSYYNFSVNFITLTLPSVQKDLDIEINHKFLNQFLIEAKRKWNVSRYVWKYEKQGNGNIHYHILTDKFIPYRELRDNWNRIIEKHNYVYEFKKKHGKTDPNTTDIHSLKKINNITQYLSKYMVKEAAKKNLQCKRKDSPLKMTIKPTIIGLRFSVLNYLNKISKHPRIWGCSHELSHIEGAQTEDLNIFIDELNKAIKQGKCKRIDKDYCSIFIYDMNFINPYNCPKICELWLKYLNIKFNFQPQGNLPL
jgi:hypothetical protein